MRERLITIDINEVNFKILKYKQFDNNNILNVEITEKKKLVDLSGYSAYFFFKLPSGEILQKNTTIENNKIKVFLDNGVFSESGRVRVEITLSNAEQIVTTFTMYFEIEETIDRNEAIQSKPEWDIISDILNGTGGTGGSIDISNKVDKEEGKGLISLSEIERLANVDNYDDTEIRELIEEKADKEQLHEHENMDILNRITEEKINKWDSGTNGFSGDYNDLINAPVVDVNKDYVDSELENKADKEHTHEELHEHENKDILDSITEEKINEWNSGTSGFSGDYNDLTNKPIIPSLDGYATETYVKNEIANAQLSGGGDGESVDLSGFATKDDLNTKADIEDIPTKISELENDSNFLTSVPSYFVTETELENKGYLTEHQDISNKVDKEDGKSLIANSEIERLKHIESNANNYVHPTSHNATMITEDENHRFVTDEEKLTWDNKSEFDGDYDSLTNKPSIPTRVSELTNDGIYATETYVQNKIAEAQLSGEGVDLSGFATKDELNAKADIEDIPTKVSELENDKGYLTEHQDISGKVDKEEGKSLIEDSEIERLKNINNYVHPTTHNATMITEDESHRFVTDEEKALWNDKSEFNGDYESLTNKPSIPTKVSELENDKVYATENYVKNEIANAQLGGEEEVDLSGLATKDELNAKADVEDIPTKVSQLENDKGYLTEHQDISGLATKNELNAKADVEDIPTKVSQLENDKGYLTEHQNLSDYATKDELNAKADVEDIPTKVSQLENDEGYLTEHQDISNKVDKEEGKSLIEDSEIEKLKNIEDNANNYVHPTTHNAMIIVEDKNHRFVSDVEKELWNSKTDFNGDYESLTNKPSIPTKVSELENDKGYLTEHIDISGKVDKEEGKSLIEDSEIERLKNVENYVHPATHNAIIIVEDKNHRFVTDTEKELWNSKSAFDGNYDSLTNKPTIPTKVSELENDNNYLTSVPNEYVTEDELIGTNITLSSGETLQDSLNSAWEKIEDNEDRLETIDNKTEGMGELSNLNTTVKDNLVSAINEINNKIGSANLVSNTISGTSLTLTNDKYQIAEIVDGTTINLPTVDSYTEIHLFFTITSDITMIMPNGIKYQKAPIIVANKTYEFIFTYTNTTIGWVFGYIEYTN